MAVLKMYPDAKLGVGPVIDNGFYYDFELPEAVSDDKLKELEKTMKKIIGGNHAFEEQQLSFAEAEELYKDQPYKLELIKEKSDGKTVQVYKTDTFQDFCKGGHVGSTKEIDVKAFKLTKTAGAYWKGSEENQMLTRIYGLAFETKADLDAYVVQLEEAAKRDHRKLGKELDLFFFSELVGPGLPLWTPKGTLLRTLLDDFVWKLRKAKGYSKVEIPHIAKKDLYETSGHWDKFGDELMKIHTREDHDFVVKPMNCPHHTQIYANSMRSYRDLPQRYCNTTMIYRDEQTGELLGLSRVRSITQDDSHVFCRESQIKDEVLAIWEIIETFYKAFGFELEVRLSLHDPQTPDKYLGEPADWKKAEQTLRDIANDQQVKSYETLGEAAFYGPKVDFMAKDSLGREWQVATIQLDFNMPRRFSLTFINEDGKEETPTMIHVAVMGSLERFISVLIEHTAGNFPFWLSPVQTVVMPIAPDKHNEYALSVVQELKTRDIRVELSNDNESLGKRIREAQLQKVPYILVVGDKEIEDKKIAVRSRDEEKNNGDIGAMSVEEFLTQAAE